MTERKFSGWSYRFIGGCADGQRLVTGDPPREFFSVIVPQEMPELKELADSLAIPKQHHHDYRLVDCGDEVVYVYQERESA